MVTEKRKAQMKAYNKIYREKKENILKRKDYIVRNKERINKQVEKGWERWRNRNGIILIPLKKLYKSTEKYVKYKGTDPEKMRGTNKLGRTYEKLALRILAHSKDANEKTFRGKYDIEWLGKKVEVKCRRWNGLAYKFTVKPGCTADLFLLFCLQFDGKKDKIEYLWLLPKKYFFNGIIVSDKIISSKFRLL